MKKYIIIISVFVITMLGAYLFKDFTPTDNTLTLPVSAIEKIYIKGDGIATDASGNTIDFKFEGFYSLAYYDRHGIETFELTEHKNVFGVSRYYVTNVYTKADKMKEIAQQLAQEINKVNNEFKEWAQAKNYPILD